MLDNESLIYHLNDRKQPADFFLISQERTQKLDLLIHLVTNLQQSLVICGPKGIGKTTLLGELKNHKKADWLIVTITATPNLSFENIQVQLLQHVIQSNIEYEHQDLSSILSLLNQKNQKIIIIIDDAGLLIPELIPALIQYTNTLNCLKVVLSLTHAELHAASADDKTKIVDSCHFIEIPPLTKTQCALFLQTLSSQPNTSMYFQSPTSDDLIEKVYKKTQGIPGKIITELPNLSTYTYSTLGDYKWKAIVISVLVITSLGLFTFTVPDPVEKEKTISDSHLSQQKDQVAINLSTKNTTTTKIIPSKNLSAVNKYPPLDHTEQRLNLTLNGQIIESETSLSTETNKKEIKNTTATSKNLPTNQKKTTAIEQAINILLDEPLIKKNIDSSPIKTGNNKIYTSNVIKNIKAKVDTNALPQKDDIFAQDEDIKRISSLLKNKLRQDKTQPISKGTEDNTKPTVNIKKIKKKTNPIKQITARYDNSLWLLGQNKKSYTIQLMVLSSRKAVKDFLKKNPTLKKDLKFFRLGKTKNNYVLVYGSYKTYSLATKRMKQLPTQYQKSWVRNFALLQKKITTKI